MSASLYVTNLPSSTTNETLAETFGRFGTVLSIKLKSGGADAPAPRCYFVEMKTTEEARAAAATLNATRIEGRLVSVSRAARS